MNADSDVESIASHAISPRGQIEPPLLLLDLNEASEMSDAEKLSAKAIAKARGKHRSKENAKKPLTNLEKNLLKRYDITVCCGTTTVTFFLCMFSSFLALLRCR